MEEVEENMGRFTPSASFEGEVGIAKLGKVEDGEDFHPGIFVEGHDFKKCLVVRSLS